MYIGQKGISTHGFNEKFINNFFTQIADITVVCCMSMSHQNEKNKNKTGVCPCSGFLSS